MSWSLPLFAALVTWVGLFGLAGHSIWLVAQMEQTGRARERQLWASLPPLIPEQLHSIQLLRQNRLLSRATSLSFSESGRYLAAGSDAAEVIIFDTAIGRRAAWFAGKGFVLDVAFSRDESLLASAESNGSIRLFGLAEGRLLNAWQGHATAVSALAFSPQEDWLASASTDATIKIWNWQQATPEHVYTLPAPVSALAVHPEGRLMAAGADNGQVWLWRIWEQEPFCRLQHAGGVADLEFQPARTALYVGGSHSISVWNVETCAEIESLYTPGQEPVSEISLSPNGRLLVAAGGVWRQPSLWIWQLPEKTLLLTGSLPPGAEAIRDVLFDPDGRVFITASHDALLRWWGVK